MREWDDPQIMPSQSDDDPANEALKNGGAKGPLPHMPIVRSVTTASIAGSMDEKHACRRPRMPQPGRASSGALY